MLLLVTTGVDAAPLPALDDPVTMGTQAFSDLETDICASVGKMRAPGSAVILEVGKPTQVSPPAVDNLTR